MGQSFVWILGEAFRCMGKIQGRSWYWNFSTRFSLFCLHRSTLAHELYSSSKTRPYPWWNDGMFGHLWLHNSLHDCNHTSTLGLWHKTADSIESPELFLDSTVFSWMLCLRPSYRIGLFLPFPLNSWNRTRLTNGGRGYWQGSWKGETFFSYLVVCVFELKHHRQPWCNWDATLVLFLSQKASRIRVILFHTFVKQSRIIEKVIGTEYRYVYSNEIKVTLLIENNAHNVIGRKIKFKSGRWLRNDIRFSIYVRIYVLWDDESRTRIKE